VAFTIIRHNVLNDQAATQQTQVDGNSLEIGRGTGNGLVLEDLHIALRHAVIEYVDGRYVIKDLETTSGTYVGHRSVRIRPLAHGDVVHIGNYNLRIGLASREGPLTIDVTRQTGDEGADGRAAVSYLARYRLSESVWTKGRLTVWGLVLVLGVPVVLLLFGNISWGKKTWRATNLLAPGGVTQAHQFIGHDCASCHTETWKAPTTTSCTPCHPSPVHHANQVSSPDCVSCHREHRSDHKPLTKMGDHFCVSCHGDLQTDTGKPPQFAQHIRAFEDGHPEFSAALKGPHESKVTRVKLSDKAALHDPGAMKLNHELHLTPERMKKLGFKPLACANCHRADKQGAYMAPITYTEHCAQCHPLEFDERFPGQVVQHGKQPEGIQDFLKDNFTRRCLERSVEQTAPPQEGSDAGTERRRPGQALALPREPQVATAASVLQCRDEGVRDAQKRLYAGGKQSVCGLCHTLQDPVAGAQLPTVVPPTIPERWLPHGEFHHQVHMRAMKHRTADNQALCESCHRPDLGASKSTQTTDILLPGIASCQECHSASGGASLQCVTCHRYHDEGMKSIRKPMQAAR